MAGKKYQSLDHELASVGYLSLVKAIKWLKAYYPEAAISYPTALRMVDRGQLTAIRIGSQYRMTRKELERFAVHGNSESSQTS